MVRDIILLCVGRWGYQGPWLWITWRRGGGGAGNIGRGKCGIDVLVESDYIRATISCGEGHRSGFYPLMLKLRLLFAV